MIKVDAVMAISLFLCLLFLFVFVRWIFYNYRGGTHEPDVKNLKQCPYCSYLFLSDKEKMIQKCPRCESYLDAHDVLLREQTDAA